MSYPELPIELFRAIGKVPTLTLHADQWGERGYFFVDGVVHRYAIDRKQQYDEWIGHWTLSEFFTRQLDPQVRAWAEALD